MVLKKPSALPYLKQVSNQSSRMRTGSISIKQFRKNMAAFKKS